MDQKLRTFLTLCQTMNYRIAADKLHLSQPAVTKQIQALENALHTKLFVYDGHTLHKTEKCLLLERYAISMQYQFEELQLVITGRERLKLRVGATKTIGDYVLIDAIKNYLSYPDHELSLVVDNTKNLLQMLDDNHLDFAIIDGGLKGIEIVFQYSAEHFQIDFGVVYQKKQFLLTHMSEFISFLGNQGA